MTKSKGATVARTPSIQQVYIVNQKPRGSVGWAIFWFFFGGIVGGIIYVAIRRWHD